MTTIRVEIENEIGWAVLDRPDSVNSLNDEMRRALPAVLARLDADPAVRVIVLRGEGSRGFCAGADIKEARAPETLLEMRDRLTRDAWIRAFPATRKPIIAAIHGACMGGGFEVALACDLRVATRDAVFALPEVGLGLIPGAGGTQRLPRMIGTSRAMAMILKGDRYSAQDLAETGLIVQISDDADALIADTRALALRLARQPPVALLAAKAAVLAAMELPMSAGMDHEQHLFLACAQSEDRKEAALAFKDKRQPAFSGR